MRGSFKALILLFKLCNKRYSSFRYYKLESGIDVLYLVFTNIFLSKLKSLNYVLDFKLVRDVNILST